MLNFIYKLVANKRVFLLLITVVVVLYFIVVNNPTLAPAATTYLIGTLIVLATLPLLALLMKMKG